MLVANCYILFPLPPIECTNSSITFLSPPHHMPPSPSLSVPPYICLFVLRKSRANPLATLEYFLLPAARKPICRTMPNHLVRFPPPPTECTIPNIPAGPFSRGNCLPGEKLFDGQSCAFVCATGHTIRAGTSGAFDCTPGASAFPNITCDRMCTLLCFSFFPLTMFARLIRSYHRPSDLYNSFAVSVHSPDSHRLRLLPCVRLFCNCYPPLPPLSWPLHACLHSFPSRLTGAH